MNVRPPGRPALTLAVLACLSACEQAAPTPDAPAFATSAANTSETSLRAAETRRPEQARPTNTKALERTCAGTSFTITSTAAAVANEQTAVHRVAPDGTSHQVVKPREMSGYAAVGLGCAIATSNGKPYFVVQYGELPSGCSFCEWFYLYDATGIQLTKSDPPTLVDRSLREADRQSPNNLEYESALRELGIPHPEIRYVEMGDEQRRL